MKAPPVPTLPGRGYLLYLELLLLLLLPFFFFSFFFCVLARIFLPVALLF